MSEAKPTPGPCYHHGPSGSQHTAGGFINNTPDRYGSPVICSVYGTNGQPHEANARLILDAFNTLADTGLTPSQLVERVKELEELLNGVLLMDRMYSGRIVIEGWQEEVLRAALSKARPNTAEGEVHADSVREDAALLSLLEELSDHDSYDTEYDGRMISLCPECGSQDGEHSKNCAFRRAKEYLAARKQAAAKEPSP